MEYRRAAAYLRAHYSNTPSLQFLLNELTSPSAATSKRVLNRYRFRGSLHMPPLRTPKRRLRGVVDYRNSGRAVIWRGEAALLAELGRDLGQGPHPLELALYVPMELILPAHIGKPGTPDLYLGDIVASDAGHLAPSEVGKPVRIDAHGFDANTIRSDQVGRCDRDARRDRCSR